MRGLVFGLLLGLAFAAHAEKYPFTIEAERLPAGDRLIAHNRGPAPILLHLALGTSSNVQSDRPLPMDVLIPAATNRAVATLSRVDARMASSYRYSYSLRMGDPAARPDANAFYRLPFQNGESYRIDQTWTGGPRVTHNSPESWYAVDIHMGRGATVVAARSGFVVNVVSPYPDGGPDPELLGKANQVSILHEDGTMSTYGHLLNYSSNIFIGTHISAGTPIGLAGTSGFSRGPHLHFYVMKNSPKGYVSVPFRFFTKARGPFEPPYLDSPVADYGPSPTALPAAQARPLRECMKGHAEIDNDVLACTQGRAP